MKKEHIIIILVGAAVLIVYIVSKKTKKISLVKQIKKGLKRVYDKDKLAAKRIEQIYRLETAHFKSKQFKNTGTPGMVATNLDPNSFFGWSSLEKFAKDQKLLASDFLIGYSKKIGDKMFDYIQFKKPILMPMFMYFYFRLYKWNYGRWFSKSETEQKKYMQDVEKVTPKFYNEFVKDDSSEG